jgi:hypothetical protein
MMLVARWKTVGVREILGTDVRRFRRGRTILTGFKLTDNADPQHGD